jgi:hypothetical protein
MYIEEQETCLTLQEHDDDDDDVYCWLLINGRVSLNQYWHEKLNVQKQAYLKHMVFNSVGQDIYTLLTLGRVGLTSTWT